MKNLIDMSEKELQEMSYDDPHFLDDLVIESPYVYGQSIYFIPDLTRLEKQEESPNYEFKLFDGNTEQIELSNGFENAITFDENVFLI